MSRYDLLNPRPDNWEPEKDASAILWAAIANYKPTSVWALFSGGHDSLCATHIAAQHPSFSGVVHIATGIGIKATRRFVYETCHKYGWPLRIYRPLKVNRYWAFVRQHGFPGPPQHSRMYQRLKERSLERHIRTVKHGRRDKVMLVSGCREQESRRRMGTAEPIQVDGRVLWVAPCVSWSSEDQHQYMATHDLPRNWVKQILCVSGECLCGAFADRERELPQLETWFPREAAEIKQLEIRARELGVPCRWGEKPREVQPEPDPMQLSIATLCWSCDLKHAEGA